MQAVHACRGMLLSVCRLPGAIASKHLLTVRVSDSAGWAQCHFLRPSCGAVTMTAYWPVSETGLLSNMWSLVQIGMRNLFLNRARVGLDLRGPYCFLNDDFSVPNDLIFHCLNISQNSPNIEYTSHLPNNVLIYCRPQFPPLGGSKINESVFWLITHIYFVAHSKTL